MGNLMAGDEDRRAVTNIDGEDGTVLGVEVLQDGFHMGKGVEEPSVVADDREETGSRWEILGRRGEKESVDNGLKEGKGADGDDYWKPGRG